MQQLGLGLAGLSCDIPFVGFGRLVQEDGGAAGGRVAAGQRLLLLCDPGFRPRQAFAYCFADLRSLPIRSGQKSLPWSS